MRMIAIDENCDARIHAMSSDLIRLNRWVVLSCLAGSLLTATNERACGQSADTPQGLSPTEIKMVHSVDAHADADLALLKKLVDLNSGTMHLAGVEAVKDSLTPQFESLGFKVRWVPMQSQTARAGTSSPSIFAPPEKAIAERSCCSSATWIQSSNHPACFSSTRLFPTRTARSRLVRVWLT